MCSTRKTGDDLLASTLLVHARQLEKKPPCQSQCPNSGDIRGWIGIIAQHKRNGLTLEQAYDSAWQKLADLNPLPATIARICPHPCEDHCSRTDKDGAVSINALERFLGDWAISRSLALPEPTSETQPESIGVIGSGPASLSFAYQMARRGYEVTIYERDETAGGMLRHAIPDYRLPKDVLDSEVERLLNLGIKLETRMDIGESLALEQLRDRHALIFLGLGAQAARHLGIPGENGPGVVSGIAYLEERKVKPRSLKGRHLLVVGGGNTAIDAARSAVRDGAQVTVVYRRREQDMPATADEVADARKEGVDFRFLLAPTHILRDGDSVIGVAFQPTEPGDVEGKGRRQPAYRDEPAQELRADMVIVAVAQTPDLHGMEAVATSRDGLKTQEDGKVDERLWAGGDDRGPGIASAAVAQGRIAAEAAHAELRGLPRAASDARAMIDSGSVRTDHFPQQARGLLPRRPEDEWLTHPEAEIEGTLDAGQALKEAARCMSCGLCMDCQLCFMYCNAHGFARIEETSPGRYFALALDACEGCGKCIELCPTGYLEARED